MLEAFHFYLYLFLGGGVAWVSVLEASKSRNLYFSISGGVLGFWGGVWCLGIVFLCSLMMQRSSCRKGDDRKKVGLDVTKSSSMNSFSIPGFMTLHRLL